MAKAKKDYKVRLVEVLDKIIDRLQEPRYFDFALDILISVVVVSVAFFWAKYQTPVSSVDWFLLIALPPVVFISSVIICRLLK